jgi:glycolate oxidase
MMIDERAYTELRAVVGAENITREPVICDTYAVQPFHRADTEKWIFRPIAVVMPACTEEVAAIMKIFNKYKIKYKSHSTGFGAQSGPGEDGVAQVDLRRMNKLIEIDEKNMFAVIEPYVPQMQIQMEAWKRGMNLLLNTAGPQTSTLASITSHQGGGASACSMGYNGRNLLGCEWVSPTGEVITIGSDEINAGLFSADGPGPSLRGIIRGYCGYDGGFGIFTKAAVKLYHWPGPAELPINNDGQLFDIEVDIPENIHFYTLLFPSWETTADAFYKIGETEVAYFMCKFPLPVLAYAYLKEVMDEIVKYPILREALRITQHHTNVIIAGNTPSDMDYKVKCLRQIVDECEGILIGGHPVTHYDKIMTMATLKASNYLCLFNGPGIFHVAMGADESIDVMLLQGRYSEGVKNGFIEEERTSDDLGDGTWATLYDHGTWGHCEATMIFDPKNPKHQPSMLQYSIACSELQIKHHLGGLGFAIYGGMPAAQMFNPVTHNFYDYTLRIKEIWDPDNLGNITLT